jgi:hypothetical protein
MSSKLATVWHSSEFDDRQSLQTLLFPEGIVYNRKKDECRTVRANQVFACMADQTRDLEEGTKYLAPSFPIIPLGPW